MLLGSVLERAQRAQSRPLELVDPPFLDLVQRHGVEVVELLPTAAGDGHEVGRLEQVEVLRDRLARHVDAGTELGEGLAALRVQPVEQLAAGRVGQRLEDHVGSPIHSCTICR